MRIDVTPNDELETKHPGQGPENEKSEARTYYYRILPVVLYARACMHVWILSRNVGAMLCCVRYCIPECAGSYTVRLYGCVHTAF
jgi:hypothetical protein